MEGRTEPDGRQSISPDKAGRQRGDESADSCSSREEGTLPHLMVAAKSALIAAAEARRGETWRVKNIPAPMRSLARIPEKLLQ